MSLLHHFCVCNGKILNKIFTVISHTRYNCKWVLCPVISQLHLQRWSQLTSSEEPADFSWTFRHKQKWRNGIEAKRKLWQNNATSINKKGTLTSCCLKQSCASSNCEEFSLDWIHEVWINFSWQISCWKISCSSFKNKKSFLLHKTHLSQSSFLLELLQFYFEPQIGSHSGIPSSPNWKSSEVSRDFIWICVKRLGSFFSPWIFVYPALIVDVDLH